MKVHAILATCGRHECLERSVACFLAQDYENKHLFIFQNSEVEQLLSSELINRGDITIRNCSRNLKGDKYSSLGDIYNTAFALLYADENIEIGDSDLVIAWDDDDLFLPDHISKGVEGIIKHGKKAYKPAQSYYRHPEGIQLISNTLEPSIFVNIHHVYKYGFSDTTTEQHLQWVQPLIDEGEIVADPEGKPTLIYNWGDTHISTYKTSGDYKNPYNFQNCRKHSQSHGDGIITPISREELDQYYKLINA